MGLFDIPGPLFSLVDQTLSFLPSAVRLALWGVLAGWLTMVVYRRLSNQEKIGVLKSEQKTQQQAIAEFDGELGELFPLIRHTLGLGLRQLGLSLGPALLATLPVLFLVVWVAGRFGHEQPRPGELIEVVAAQPGASSPKLSWRPAGGVSVTPEGWRIAWPEEGKTVELTQSDVVLLKLPAESPIPVIHAKRWWNLLMANPIGYLPPDAAVDSVSIGLPQKTILPFGPGWMQGWMFTFFGVFLLSSVAFKVALKID